MKEAEEKVENDFSKKFINFVTVARLVPQKALDRLIKIHYNLIKNLGHKHNFYIIGDGPEKEKLEKMIKKYNVENSFFLLGKKENPYPYIKNADYFCLLSQFEGYGMVLEEAKILNKPIIITNTAAREAVEEYKNAIILENETKQIYEGIERIIERGLKIREEFKEYDNQKILKQVDKIIGGK